MISVKIISIEYFTFSVTIRKDKLLAVRTLDAGVAFL